MSLVLFRHGPAGSFDPARWPDDALRPLTEDGRGKTRDAAEGLARLVGAPVLVCASPYLRTRQTAELVAQALGAPAVQVVDDLAPGATPATILSLLEPLDPDTTLVVVGHEPDLGVAAGRWLADLRGTLPFKKAGACRIDFEGAPAAGTGTLAWFASPKLLRLLGRRKVAQS